MPDSSAAGGHVSFSVVQVLPLASQRTSRIIAALSLAGYLSALVVSSCFHTHSHHHGCGDAHAGTCPPSGLHTHLVGATHGHAHSHSHGSHSHAAHSHDDHTVAGSVAGSEPHKHKSPQSPVLPHDCDDCAICHFLAQASLAPAALGLSVSEAISIPLTHLPWSAPVAEAFSLQPARGPPALFC